MATATPVNLGRTNPSRPAPRAATVYLGRADRQLPVPGIQSVHMPQPVKSTQPAPKIKPVKLGTK
jgi:hypothetical protein